MTNMKAVNAYSKNMYYVPIGIRQIYFRNIENNVEIDNCIDDEFY